MIGYDRGGTGEILKRLFPEGLVEEGDIEDAARKTTRFLTTPPTVKENTIMTLANMQSATLATYDALMTL